MLFGKRHDTMDCSLRELVTDLSRNCYGEVANLFQTCYGETSVMDFLFLALTNHYW